MDETRQYFRFEPSGKFGLVSSADCNIVYRKGGKEIISGTLETFSSWNLRTGTLTTSWNDSDNKSSVTCLQVSPSDSNVLAAGYEDGSVRLWNLEQSESTVVLRGHKTAVTALCFDPTGTRLASGAKDTDIVLWDLASESGLYRLRGHNNAITAILFLTNYHIVTSSKDSLVKLWDLQAQHCVETVVSHRAEVSSFFFTVDRSLMLTVGADQFIRLFRIDLKALENKLKVGNDSVENVFSLLGEVQKSSKERALQIQVHNEMNVFCILSSDRSVEVIRFSTVEDVKKKLQRRRKRQKSDKAGEVEEIAEESQNVSVEPSDLVKSVRFFRLDNRARSFAFGNTSPARGTFRLAFGFATNCIEEFEIDLEKPEEEPERVASIDLPGHRSEVKVVAISSDSRLILSASVESIKIWNSESGTCIRTLECENVLCAQFVQGNEYILAGSKDGTLRIFELATGSEADPVSAHSGAIWSIAIRPDKKGFATGSADKTVKFWEFKNSSTRAEGFKIKNIRSLQVADDVLCVKYSPDCRYIAVSLLDLTVKVFFEDTLKFYLNLFGHKLPVMAIDISFDSKILISASADKNIKVWGLDFGDCRKSLFANQDAITGLAFIPKTYQFISSGKDGVVKYWTDDQYSLLQKLEGHKGEIWAMALSPRSNILVTVSSDRSIRVWNRSDEQLFLEEERENQIEEMLEASLLSGNNHEEQAEQSEEVGAANKKSLDTLRATEKLADAIDAADEELEKWEVFEEAKRTGVPGIAIAEPTPGPYFMTVARGKSPAELVLMTFSQIPAIELEMALLSLPFTHIKSLFKYIETWMKGNMNIGLSSRILSCLIRLYFTQIVADSKLRVSLEEIRRIQKEKLTEFRNLLGLNAKMMKNHLKHYEIEHSKTIA
jgi:U3 small nucleolar RNA-associated protein 12